MRNFVAKVHFSTDERDHIDAQAKALNLSRSELIRLRALGDPTPGFTPPKPQLTQRQYQDAVLAALKASQGSCSRHHCETITAAVLCTVFNAADKPTGSSHHQQVG